LSENNSYDKYAWNIFEEGVTDVTGIEEDCRFWRIQYSGNLLL